MKEFINKLLVNNINIRVRQDLRNDTTLLALYIWKLNLICIRYDKKTYTRKEISEKEYYLWYEYYDELYRYRAKFINNTTH